MRAVVHTLSKGRKCWILFSFLFFSVWVKKKGNSIYCVCRRTHTARVGVDVVHTHTLEIYVMYFWANKLLHPSLCVVGKKKGTSAPSFFCFMLSFSKMKKIYYIYFFAGRINYYIIHYLSQKTKINCSIKVSCVCVTKVRNLPKTVKVELQIRNQFMRQ